MQIVHPSLYFITDGSKSDHIGVYMTILRLNALSAAKLAIQTINHKREVVWENDKFTELFGSHQRKGSKCWELMHPSNPRCEKCETRESYIREIQKNGRKKQYFINNSRIGNDGYVKFIEDVSKIVGAYEKINEEIEGMKRRLSILVDRLDTIVICSSCKRLRLKDGTWVDDPIAGTEALFAKHLSHGYCPTCAKKIIAEI